MIRAALLAQEQWMRERSLAIEAAVQEQINDPITTYKDAAGLREIIRDAWKRLDERFRVL